MPRKRIITKSQDNNVPITRGRKRRTPSTKASRAKRKTTDILFDLSDDNDSSHAIFVTTSDDDNSTYKQNTASPESNLYLMDDLVLLESVPNTAEVEKVVIHNAISNTAQNVNVFTTEEIGGNNENLPIKSDIITDIGTKCCDVRRPPSLSDDGFTDDSDEDLYECDFNNLKKTVCSEIKKANEEKFKTDVNSTTDIDSDDLDLIPLPKTRVNRPRTSKKSKLIQQSLQDIKENLNKPYLQDDQFLDNSALSDVCIVEKVIETLLVRIYWGTEYKRYELTTEEPFVNIYKKLAEEHNVLLSEIVLSLNGKIINPSDTIKSIKLSRSDAIEGGIIRKEADSSLADCDLISIKVQCSNRRESVTISIGKFEKMETLMKKYANLRSLDIAKLKFHFDGEKLSPDETPFSLDLEGDECIDAFEIA